MTWNGRRFYEGHIHAACLHPLHRHLTRATKLRCCRPFFRPAATQSALEKLVASKPKFSDIFETASPVNNTANFCPAGFLATNTPISPYLATGADGKQFYIECLKVKVSRCAACMRPPAR
jgi:hypothetical protein